MFNQLIFSQGLGWQDIKENPLYVHHENWACPGDRWYLLARSSILPSVSVISPSIIIRQASPLEVTRM
jgi:hypothetical protein